MLFGQLIHGENDREINRRRQINLLIYFLFAVLMIYTLSKKENLYVDEVYSYGLANHSTGPYMSIEDGQTYYPAGTPWIEYMSVSPGHRFDYSIVWSNQEQDVHPPLYYVLLHTICSFMPGVFSIWFAGLINIVFALGTLYFVRKLVWLWTEDELLQNIISLGFVCSAGILSAVSFLRMYIMAMFWVTALTYLILRQIGEQLTVRFCLLLLLCTAGGALTHYYCIVYTVFISVVYGCCLLWQKRWKETGFFCLTQGIAGLLSFAVFPAMTRHIFSSGRGEQSAENLIGISMTIWFKRVGLFFNLLDGQLFGGIFVYVFFAALTILFVRGLRKADVLWGSGKQNAAMRYLCGTVPIVLYFILVSKIAVYLTDRYMYPIYAVLFVTIICGIVKWIRSLIGRQYAYVCTTAFIIAVMTVNGWKNIDWIYLFQSSQTLKETASAYADVDCVFVYDKLWETNSAYYEASGYHSVTFFTLDDLDMLESSDISSHYNLILMTTDDDEEVLETVLELCPALGASEHLGEYAYTNTYYLHPAENN